MSERERFEAWAMSCKCPPELLAMGADYGGKGLLAGQWAAWQAALARSGQAASGSSQGARSDDQSGAGQPEAPTAAPPGSWDEYAMREAQRLWNLPAMPKPQLVASLHCALIDAMRFAASPQPAAPEGWKLVPIEATPEMVQAYLRANDAYWHRTDALPDKLGVWRQGTPTEATAESYRAMLAAAPAAEGGAS